ncbi:MAG: hypothetical protein JSS66_06615 [Armatimonadetes bacterium]|nr:hypothetical protein [Armatimonadota bacterium]
MHDKLSKLASIFVNKDDDEAKPSPAPKGVDAELAELTKLTGSGNAWDQWEKLAKGEGGASANPVPLTNVIAAQPGPNLDTVRVNVPAAPTDKPVDEFVMPKQKPDGTWDFAPIYLSSNLVPPPFTAEQAREIIASLPESLGLDIRRQTVSKAISAIGQTLGVTPDVIAADAALKIAAVHDFQSKVEGKFKEYEVKATQAIADLQKKIQDTQTSIEGARKRSDEVSKACLEEIDKLDDVTEFFSLDQGGSKYAPPAPVEASKT